MTAEIQPDEMVSMRNTLHKVAEFVALFETAEEKLKHREHAIEQRLIATEKRIGEQLLQIKSVLADFQNIMTEAGAARWRVAAEQSMKKNDEYLKNVRYATDEFIRCTDESYQKLNKATDYTVKGLSKAIHSFRMDDFQSVTTTSVDMVRGTCEKSIRKMNEVIRWFHWRNIALVLSVTIVVTMVTGLYMNDEWPWESHQQVMQQRHLATAVEAAWPHLSSIDQQEILHTATENIA